MKNYDVALRPIHYASVSGGKDSFYMLGLILNNLFETGKLNTAQFNTIFNIIAEHMWECI